MNFKSFLQKITPELLDDGFSVFLHKSENLDGWSGWMSAEEGEKEYVVAVDHHLGFETAIHEYCHYLQSKFKPELWKKSNDTYNYLLDWVDDLSLEYSPEQLDQSLHDILELEHDCEKMSIDFILENNISSIDINRYCRAANSYLWHYHINRKYRKRPKQPIYSSSVISSMSPVLENNLDFYLNITNLTQDQYDTLYKEYP
jgi:hypothetical protein